MEGFFWLGVFIVVLIFAAKIENKEGDTMNLQKQQELENNIICPHCHTKGTVTTRQVKQKQGIHGGKATAAVLTCGITLLGTGLSRKNRITQAHCSNCGQTWTF